MQKVKRRQEKMLEIKNVSKTFAKDTVNELSLIHIFKTERTLKVTLCFFNISMPFKISSNEFLPLG